MREDIDLYKRVFNNRNYHLFDACDESSPLRFIHWVKRSFLKQLLLSIPNDVDAIIVFGSAVNLRHHEGSDLDLAILGEHGTRSMRELCANLKPDFGVDIIDYRSLKDIEGRRGTNMYWVEDDILDYGVPIFVRGLDFNIGCVEQICGQSHILV